MKKEMIKLMGFKKIDELADSAVCDRGNVWVCLVLVGDKVYLQVNSNRAKTEVNTEDLQIIEEMFGFNNGKIIERIDAVRYLLGTTDLKLWSASLIYEAEEQCFVVDDLCNSEDLFDIQYFLTHNEGAKLVADEEGRLILKCK